VQLDTLWNLLRGALLAAALHAGAAGAAALPARQTIAITDVAVIDLRHNRPSPRRTVLIEAGRIVSVTDPRTARLPAQAVRVDGRGRFLVPGLVDMHVHLFNNYSRRPPNDWAFALFVANGVTAVREMNAGVTDIAQVARWRQALDDGSLAAPRILAAGVAVRGLTAADLQREAAAAAGAGADFLKVFSPLPAAQWPALRAAAKAYGLPLAGHAPAQLALLDTAGGLASNEHLMQLPEACSDDESMLLQQRRGRSAAPTAAEEEAEELQVLQDFDAGRCRRVAAALAATGQVQVPTLVLAHTEFTQHARPAGSDPRRRYLRADEDERWTRALAQADSGAAAAALAVRRWPAAKRIAGILHRAGVHLMAGTDAPMPLVYPGFALHDELALLVAAGLTPREALRAATLEPAEFLHIDATAGSVEAGKRADLLLLDADPLRDIRNTRRIHAAVLDGRLLARPDLDALLAGAARDQPR
jgi:imidazolonepropionase-like amidohydrolase